MKAMLMLEDGKTFSGYCAGAIKERVGKVVINTSVVGYQELSTDPANSGKLIVMTYPLIGNYGIAEKFNRTSKVWAAGMIIKENSRIVSNWQSEGRFDEFAQKSDLFVLAGIDTRSLAVHIRQKGEMLGIVSADCYGAKELAMKIDQYRASGPESVLPKVSVERITAVSPGKKGGQKIAILDIGVTRDLVAQIQGLGFNPVIFPFTSGHSDILACKPRALVISSGPEEDPGLDSVVENIKPLIGRVPIMGLSAGCLVLARALGAGLTKLKLGHRGINYPVHYPGIRNGSITVQNHSLVIDAGTIGKVKSLKITGYNLNDHSVEEIESKSLKILGTQYEICTPGFDEVNPALIKFSKILSRRD